MVRETHFSTVFTTKFNGTDVMGIYTTFLNADDILLIWHYIIYVKKSPWKVPSSKQQRSTDATQLRLNYAFGTSVIRAREQTVIIGKKRYRLVEFGTRGHSFCRKWRWIMAEKTIARPGLLVVIHKLRQTA
jgi:hypothetical protein